MTTSYLSAERQNDGKIYEIPIVIHPSFDDSDVVIVNYPGFGGDISGYNNKYGKLAEFLREQTGATVVRLGNHHWITGDYPTTVVDDLRCVIDLLLSEHGPFGGRNIKLCLMGFSAGASAVAVVAKEYECCRGILLMAPSFDAGREAIETGLGQFTGNVYAVVGADDEVVGNTAAWRFTEMAKMAEFVDYHVIPDCDHQFRGTVNGRIMSQAPLWAFFGQTDFPNPTGGIELY